MPLAAHRGALVLAIASTAVLAIGLPVAAGPPEATDLQWGLDQIGAPAAWATATGGGVAIAVVDSGVDLEHQDLQDRIVGHVSCVGSDGDPARCDGPGQDDHGHGTHVAGVAVATADNGVGVAGVAPDARLLAVRALVDDCTDAAADCAPVGAALDVAAGVRWAVAHGADVINLSLGGTALQSGAGCPLCAAIEDAWDDGAIVVMSAGNDTLLPAELGDLPAVIVTATARDDEPASYADDGSDLLASARWALAAPGGEAEVDPDECAAGGRPRGIVSTYWVDGARDQYACLAGTSMAAPHVAGALAVLLSTGLVPQEAIDRLLATAADLGDPGPDDRYGTGRLDLAAAVRVEAAERRVPWATISVAIVGLLGAVLVVRRARHRPEPG